MKKSDLKTGHKVQLRDGSFYVVLLGVEMEVFSGDCIVDARTHSWFDLDNYNEDLTHCGIVGQPEEFWDIIRVFRQYHPYQIQNPWYENVKESEILWERNKEPRLDEEEEITR